MHTLLASTPATPTETAIWLVLLCAICFTAIAKL